METGVRAALAEAIDRATGAMRRTSAGVRLSEAMDRFALALAADRLDRRHNPNWPSQPRVPRGNPDGDRWTDGGGSNGASDDIVLTAAKISPALERECLEQLERDTFLCTMIRNRACHAQAMERYAACLAGRPIPPLNF